MAWHGVQIYYYDEDKDGLLLDCVRPLFEQVAAHADRLVFTRHWRRGSHLRLGVRAGEAAYRETIEPAVDRTVRPYLQTHPSTTAVDEPAMLAVHRLLAPQEQETGDLAPFRPDNSVHQDPYDRRLPTLGSEAAAALLEDFYHDTNSLVFGVLEQVRAGRSRMTVALDLM
ncbi:MAG TPA: lantibiotic dehydratase C-terminal domain-containing protein, partial [Actinoplanes sp.]|nr:lantibiotic dehydratase C-terminal domain-containing protein [Actinoplanes sp.]